MTKPTKSDLAKYRQLLEKNLAVLNGDVGSLRDEALRSSEQDFAADSLADQGAESCDQGFLLGLIENEEETIVLIEEALERMLGEAEYPFGACVACFEAAEATKPKSGAKKYWIPKARLEYLPWARYCVAHQSELEEGREIA
ncbi:MAG: hypothetical protein QF412_04970 [Planctomycetota bacterium]|jgi:RNA polymerase-binding transcription factor DksA|nr:hypothetical protein [Planctomycetota bacterium]